MWLFQLWFGSTMLIWYSVLSTVVFQHLKMMKLVQHIRKSSKFWPLFYTKTVITTSYFSPKLCWNNIVCSCLVCHTWVSYAYNSRGHEFSVCSFVDKHRRVCGRLKLLKYINPPLILNLPQQEITARCTHTHWHTQHLLTGTHVQHLSY